MKLLFSNGRILRVYDIYSPILTLKANGVPLKYNGYRVVEDEEARATIRQLLDSKLYQRAKALGDPPPEVGG